MILGDKMHNEKLFEILDELNEKYIRVWEDVCNIESPTDSIDGVNACCDYFVKIAEGFGWQVEKLPLTVAGSPVCITMNPNAKGTPISLSGHIDTVFPIGMFGTPAVHFDEKYIYGPGVCDCKGGVVGGLYAMEVLHRLGFTDRPVKLLLQTDEEISSINSKKATINWILEKSKDSVAFINLEGHTHGVACVQRKGIITFVFKVHGVEAHSSRCAKAGANAIAEAAHKIIELEKIKDDEGITCSCNIISGGIKTNTVAGYCEFKCNVRYATMEQLEWIRQEAKKIADTVYVNGCVTEVVEAGIRATMEPNERTYDLLDKMNRVWAENGLETLKPGKRTGGSDAADATVFGLAAIDNLGAEGDKIHTLDEYAVTASLKVCATRLVFACMGL